MDPIIIRPSGIWNSRAPFNDYFQRLREITRGKVLATVGAYQLRKTLLDAEKGTSFRKVMEKRIPLRIWMTQTQDFSKSYSQEEDKSKYFHPNTKEALDDVKGYLDDIEESAIIQLAGAFESFAQCWALNYLSATAEKVERHYTDSEMRLIDWFNPCMSDYPPTLLDILRAFPQVKLALTHTPHAFRHPGTKEKIERRISGRINAYESVKFWRRYRNNAIHFSRMVTTKFYKQNHIFFDEAMKTLGIKLRPRARLPFHDALFGAMAASHYRAGLVMNQMLESVSRGFRGHPEAPAEKTTEVWPRPVRSPMLFMEGDYPPSVAWVFDEEWREAEAARRGWELLDTDG